MKALLVLALQTWAAKLRTLHEAPSACPENQFPVVSLTVQGIGFQGDVLPPDETLKLQENLAGHPDWSIGKPWVLSLSVESREAEDRDFGFAGGEGFLAFRVPKASLKRQISVQSNVESLAQNTRLEYRGGTAITAPEAIHFTEICLRPATCDHFFATQPSMCRDGLWVPKRHPEAIVGHTRRAGCQKIRCEDAAPCDPPTKYERRPDYDTAFGSKPEHCCLPKLCGDICGSQGQRKPGDVLGSTTAECCSPSDCDEVLCPGKFAKKLRRYDSKGQRLLLQGSTPEECCEPSSCSEISCEDSDQWKKNESATVGNSIEDCCSPLFCANHSCEPASQWERDPHAELGSSNPSCCKPKLCKDFTCEEGFTLRAGALMAKKQLRGSTSEECCERKMCRDWTCSDPSKWVQKADETNRDLERRGWSDEECCSPISCSSVDCLPESLWSPRAFVDVTSMTGPAEELEGVQGSTSKQCCNPRWCANYTCTGDIPSLNISSTKWFKKVDTNHFRFQGSTDDECCHPKYCSDFFTAFPSKYERKPEDLEKPRQGSSEAECYNELKCSDYCCVDPKLQHKEDAEHILGSTDEECCEPQ